MYNQEKLQNTQTKKAILVRLQALSLSCREQANSTMTCVCVSGPCPLLCSVILCLSLSFTLINLNNIKSTKFYQHRYLPFSSPLVGLHLHCRWFTTTSFSFFPFGVVVTTMTLSYYHHYNDLESNSLVKVQSQSKIKTSTHQVVFSKQQSNSVTG